MAGFTHTNACQYRMVACLKKRLMSLIASQSRVSIPLLKCSAVGVDGNVNLGFVNEKLAESTFSFYVNRWWRAAKPYVDRERMLQR
jgi:hypothetical protein